MSVFYLILFQVKKINYRKNIINSKMKDKCILKFKECMLWKDYLNIVFQQYIYIIGGFLLKYLG